MAKRPPERREDKGRPDADGLGQDAADNRPDQHRRHRQHVEARTDPTERSVFHGRLANRDGDDVECCHRAVRQQLLSEEAGEAEEGRIRGQRDEGVADRHQDHRPDEEPGDAEPPHRPPGDRRPDE